MLYLANEIRLCLLIVAILAFILGWIVKSILSNRKLKSLKKDNDKLMEKMYDMEASSSSKAAGTSSKDSDGTYDVTEIEGIGQGYKAKMNTAYGISSIEDLLSKGATPEGRMDLAESVNLDVKIIDKWIRMADLTRINGIRGNFAELIEAAGVESVTHLSAQEPSELTEILIGVNKKSNHSRIDPTEDMVLDWIEKSKNLPEIIK